MTGTQLNVCAKRNPVDLSVALGYAKLGWLVLPVNRNKKPMTDNGFHNASTDQVQINTWLTVPETFEKAKRAAPGFDVYYLEQEWREWISKKGERPKAPDAAFIGFCRRKAEKNSIHC